MKPQTETNVIHPYLRNLAYHCLDDNALHTITFDRAIFLNCHREAIISDIQLMSACCEKAVLSDLNTGKIRVRGAREFLEKLMHLEHLDIYSDAFLGESISGLKEKGLTHFLDFCTSFNLDPLIAIAYQAVNFGHFAKDLDINLLKDLSSIMEKNPELNKFLNHAAIITARELGLISSNECLILRSLQEDLKIQNFEVHGLGTLLRNAVHVVKKLKNSPLRTAKTHDEELTALLSGSSVVSFTTKLFTLRGYNDLQEKLKFPEISDLNWDGEKIKGLNNRSGNRG